MSRNPIAKQVTRIPQQVIPERREKLHEKAERKDDAAVDRDLVKEIAMDIGKEIVYYIERMYPQAIGATPSTFKLSVRNSIHNEIMAALEVNEEGAIRARLDFRKKFRRHLNKLRKVASIEELLAVVKDAPENPALGRKGK